ncbi:MAG: alanine racemase [Patescibacteria group bacterium]|jgi:alanine racemase
MKQAEITWIEISKTALTHNIKEFFRYLPKETQLMAVVKSNAYGHGLVQCAKIFGAASVKWLGTVNLEEALSLRNNKIKSKILVLSFFNPGLLPLAVKKDISLAIYGYQAAKRISLIAQRLKKTARLHIKIDTGTTRLGLMPSETVKTVTAISQLKNIQIEGIFSHFSDAENPDQSITNKQIIIFKKVIKEIEEQGIVIHYKHLACSAAALLNPQSFFNLVRIGISAYGLSSIENSAKFTRNIKKRIKLIPALSWYTRIIQIKRIPRGTKIGYSGTFSANKRMKIAVIPVGYWDGYDRRLSNCGEVLINNKKCKIRGRICMNLSMVDVTSLKNVKAGDKVILIGQSGKLSVTADDLAKKINTINYEIVTRINPLMPRQIIK